MCNGMGLPQTRWAHLQINATFKGAEFTSIPQAIQVCSSLVTQEDTWGFTPDWGGGRVRVKRLYKSMQPKCETCGMGSCQLHGNKNMLKHNIDILFQTGEAQSFPTV